MKEHGAKKVEARREDDSLIGWHDDHADERRDGEWGKQVAERTEEYFLSNVRQGAFSSFYARWEHTKGAPFKDFNTSLSRIAIQAISAVTSMSARPTKISSTHL